MSKIMRQLVEEARLSKLPKPVLTDEEKAFIMHMEATVGVSVFPLLVEQYTDVISRTLIDGKSSHMVYYINRWKYITLQKAIELLQFRLKELGYV